MTSEEAIQVADELLLAHAGSPMKDIQRMILRESLAGKRYEQMVGYDYQHIKNEGSQLWKLLAEALGEKVSKKNFKGALEKRLKSGSILPKPPIPSTYNEQTWIGREALINNLLLKLQGQTRLLWITGTSGIGKTALGECLASQAWESDPSFQWIYLEILEGQSRDFPSIAADLLGKLGAIELAPMERNDPKRLCDSLLRKLQNNHYWVQFDSLERLINSDQPTEFADTYWQTFLQQCLTSETFRSRLVLTSQVLPKAMKQLSDRNFWHQYTLEGLSVSESLDLFEKRNIADAVDARNESILSQIGQAYEGHPLVLQVVTGEITSDFESDVVKYWERYSDEFAQVARTLEAKRVDPFLYNQELKEQVRDRVEASLKRLAPNAFNLLCCSAVYRRSVPQAFWQAMLWDCSTTEQQESYSQLRSRALIEKENTARGQDIIRQHNLIRDIAYDLLRQDSATWKTSERKAAEMWLTVYQPAPDVPNLEKVRGQIEAFHHFCELEDWDAAKTVLLDQELGMRLQIWGYYREMIVSYHKLMNHLNSSYVIVCKRGLGNAYFSLSKYNQAINYWQESLELAHEIGDRQGEGAALGNLGLAYRELSDYTQAINLYQQSLAIARELGNYRVQSNALCNLGNAYYCLSNYTQAIEFYQQSLAIARELGDRQGEGRALGNLGNAYNDLSNYTQAIEFYQQHLTITREISDWQGEGNALGNLGNVYYNLGNYAQAIECHQQHLAIACELGDRKGEGVALGNLGLAYDGLVQYAQAIEFYQQSLAIARELGDRRGEAIALGNWGSANCALGNYDEAVKLQNQKLTIARDIGDRGRESSALSGLGEAFIKLGQYSDASGVLQTALTISREIGERSHEAEILKNLAELHQEAGSIDLAKQYCDRALELAIELGVPLQKECQKLKEDLETGRG